MAERLESRLPIGRVLARGMRRRCPRCGEGRLFAGWYRLLRECPRCGLDYQAHAHDTWALIYFSTAGLTGVVLVALIYIRPWNLLYGRVLLLATALTLIVLSLPTRKSLAIALNFLVELRIHRPDPSGAPR